MICEQPGSNQISLKGIFNSQYFFCYRNMLWAMLLTAVALDTVGGLSAGLGHLTVGRNNLPSVLRVPFLLVVHLEEVRDRDVHRAMAYAVATSGAGDGRLTLNDSPDMEKGILLLFVEGMKLLQIRVDVGQFIHTA